MFEQIAKKNRVSAEAKLKKKLSLIPSLLKKKQKISQKYLNEVGAENPEINKKKM